MRTLAHKPQSTQNIESSTQAKPGRAFSGQSPDADFILHWQRTIGNQAVQRLLLPRTDGVAVSLAGDESIGVDYDVSQIPVPGSIRRSIQPKLKVGDPGDQYEREADRVGALVAHQSLPVGGDYGETEEHSKPRTLTSGIQLGSNFGLPLDSNTNEEMSRKIGFDLSSVRVHNDDAAIYMNKRLNARAFTCGSDIFFNKGEYNPNSLGGKKLLAHELTHVVQQSGMTDGAAQRKMIQCTSIGDILDEFFSPFSSETLWIMDENDNYTRIVRTWQPVIASVNRLKANVEANCTTWSTSHRTDSSWTPGLTDPPVADPNAFLDWVASPPGTDPQTCKDAFIVYVTTKVGSLIPVLPIRETQTFELYTCSIGSFGIFATVDSIDCTAKTAELNIWMYNSMDQGSFGPIAQHPAFRLCGMERQVMWWNWKVPHSWGPLPAVGNQRRGPGWGGKFGGW